MLPIPDTSSHPAFGFAKRMVSMAFDNICNFTAALIKQS